MAIMGDGLSQCINCNVIYCTNCNNEGQDEPEDFCSIDCENTYNEKYGEDDDSEEEEDN